MRLRHWDGLLIPSSRQDLKSRVSIQLVFIILQHSGVGTEIGCLIRLRLPQNMASGINLFQQITKYRWFRIWEYFLAYSTIVSRQGSATCYQILLHKVPSRLFVLTKYRILMHSIVLTAFPRNSVLKFREWAGQVGLKVLKDISRNRV